MGIGGTKSGTLYAYSYLTLLHTLFPVHTASAHTGVRCTVATIPSQIGTKSLIFHVFSNPLLAVKMLPMDTISLMIRTAHKTFVSLMMG